uniref:G-protein coupled receptors family 1 profile domain-containing protein n=1 Tax=Strix occidentalis caurina TaxID=311401 RepID=A0A8D0KVB6_STROC
MPPGQGQGWRGGSLCWARQGTGSFLVQPGAGVGCGERWPPRGGSVTMDETNTTDPSLIYMTSGHVDYWEILKNECLRIPYGLIVFAGVSMGISLCGLAGNGIVMWFLGFHMKQNPFTVYFLNLAVADFSLLLLFFIIVEFLCHFFELSSLGLLTTISVERCISVFFPIWYRCHRPKHLSGIVSGMSWALTGFFVFSMSLSFSFAEGYETVFAGIAIAVSTILSSTMLISNLLLFIKLQCGSQRRQPGKLYVVVLLSVIFFFAFGIPFSVEVFLNLPSSHELLPEKTTFLLALLNCSINPVIYFLVGSWRQCRFQGSMKVALRRVFEEKVGKEGPMPWTQPNKLLLPLISE